MRTVTFEELELALILAKASNFNYYYQNPNFDELATSSGIHNVHRFMFNNNEQGYVIGFLGCYKHYIIISIKGTDCLSDWKTNISFSINNNGFNGGVHNGFAQAVINSFDELLKIIKNYISKDKRILLTGHSLGGALAILTAHKLSCIDEFRNRIEAVYTYGAPRVGNRAFKKNYRLNHYRFEYGSDPVPSSPSLGYEDIGIRYYLPKNEPTIMVDAQGSEAYSVHIRLGTAIAQLFLNSSNLCLIQKSIEHMVGVFDDVSDHNIEKYILHIQNYQHFIATIKGLQQGSLRRYGGVIRETKTKNIICHLLEPPQGVYSLVTKGQRLLQMTQIAAGASVLPIGVSVMALSYMNNQLIEIQTQLRQEFHEVTIKLDYIIREQQEAKIREFREQISELQAAIDTQVLSQNLPQVSYQEKLKLETYRTARKVRLFLSAEAQRTKLNLNDYMPISPTNLAMKGWAIATAIEAYLLLDLGNSENINKAENFLLEEIEKFREIVCASAEVLLADTTPHIDIATAYRFTAKVFQAKNITQEQVDRIAMISPRDKELSEEAIRQKLRKVKVEFDMSYAPEKYNHNWINEQIMIFEYLDMLSELLAKLESLLDFAKLCKNKGIQNIRDILPVNNSLPGLYLQF
ncbi:lipase family protein [Aetokthonos hydrillicola Thurmond2011]|jgi:hypothetical protein|uniref:Lipase family protein n=1 Tax=Aetokthonos hydrillicola Thurmond2011 TaxID=2712845 RepID=A0AAP5M848_9CYAN|nr:lipase family protein [Aetokthonos hydrillicola]MBO3459303.1 lipase family protein [Aetokthonos hydrillicola CCALA 1050]MBW4587729.1 lipase family protein [Aetokthonos hydrillicola CCALA 1050]MDR9894377.1 lipase family protein [Aetokthonos hydrillicola Thurmond2011]